MRGWIGFDMALRVFDFGWTGVWRCKASNVLPSPRHDAGSAQSGQDRSVRGLTSIRSNFSHSWYRAKLVLRYIYIFFRMYTLHPECQHTSENSSNHCVFRSMLRLELAVLGVSSHQCEQIRRPSNDEALQRIYLTADAAREI